jgi:UDP-glucuronate decarboxylase
MRILVTGGAGFIGSHLCRSLLKNGDEVIALDNLSTGSLDNIQDCLDSQKFEFVKHDVIEQIYLEVDQIFNLACPASPIHYQRDPIFTMKTNVIGTLNMANMATKLNIPLLQASTSEVYGDPQISPQPEEYWGNVNSYGVRSCYDEGKRAAEALLFDFRNKFNLNSRIARIFNTYGPRMQFNDGRVVSNFLVQSLSGQPITIYGDGSQTRSLCYISDLIDGLIKLMNSNEKITTPINLGNPNNFSILEIASLILSHTNSNSKIVFKELPIDDPKKRLPDITKAKKILNWEPKISFNEGLSLMIEDFKVRLKNLNVI